MSTVRRPWRERGFWGAAALTAPVYGWLLWHAPTGEAFGTFVGGSLVVLTAALVLGTLSAELRAALLGMAFSMVATFAAATAFVVLAISTCDCFD